MTNEEIDKLVVGRELDAIVAEKVMGCTIEWYDSYEGGPDTDKVRKCGCPDSEHNTQSDRVPSGGMLAEYSTDIAEAWEVVKKLSHLRCEGKFYKPVIRLEFYEHDGLYSCRIGRCKSVGEDDDVVGHAEERTAEHVTDWSAEQDRAMCLAICRAALKAVGA